jgi:hypothetical protein
MLYFIGGASRSGKSQLVRKLLSANNVPYFPLDAVMMACSKRPECFKMNHQDSPQERSVALWPFTEEIVNTTSYHLDNYAFEGDYIFPNNIKAFEKKYSGRRFSAVFLGYADIDPEKKLQDIRRFSSLMDWTRKRSDEQLLEHIKVHIAISITLRDQCAIHGFPYFEAKNDFAAYLDDVYQTLTQNS